MKSVLSVIGLVLASIAVPAVAEPSYYGGNDQWSVYGGAKTNNDEGYCFMTGEYKQGDELIVALMPHSDKVLTAFVTKSANGFRIGATVKYQLLFLNDRRSDLDQGWGNIQMVIGDFQGKRAFSFTTTDWDTYLNDLSRNTHIALGRDDDSIVNSWKLDGTANAIAQLRECANHA
jgi:hypothetical protein